VIWYTKLWSTPEDLPHAGRVKSRLPQSAAGARGRPMAIRLTSWLEEELATQLLLGNHWVQEKNKVKQAGVAADAERVWRGLYHDNGSCLEITNDIHPERNCYLRLTQACAITTLHLFCPLTLFTTVVTLPAHRRPDANYRPCLRRVLWLPPPTPKSTNPRRNTRPQILDPPHLVWPTHRTSSTCTARR
jgi:hypothetical protein